MTPAEMITEINDFGFDDVASARKYALLNDALDEITSMEPWPWREAAGTLTFVGSVATPVEVATIGKPIAITNPTTGTIVMPKRSEEFQKQHATVLTQAGDPEVYYFDGYNIKFWPVPSSSVVLTIRHLKEQAAVDSSSVEGDVLMPPRYHWAAIWLAMSRLSFKDDDLAQSNYALGQCERKISLLRNDAWFRSQYDRSDTVQVLDPDDWYE